MTVPLLPTRVTDPQRDLLITLQKVNEVLQGRANVTGTLTLASGATTTVVLDNLFSSDQVPVLIPTTANAATAIATTYITSRNNGTFTLTHANNGQTDRTFLYLRWG